MVSQALSLLRVSIFWVHPSRACKLEKKSEPGDEASMSYNSRVPSTAGAQNADDSLMYLASLHCACHVLVAFMDTKSGCTYTFCTLYNVCVDVWNRSMPFLPALSVPHIVHSHAHTHAHTHTHTCLLYTSPSPRDATLSRMPSSA